MRLPFPVYRAAGPGRGIRWFPGPDPLLRDDDVDLPARARSGEALDRVRDLLPGEWREDGD